MVFLFYALVGYSIPIVALMVDQHGKVGHPHAFNPLFIFPFEVLGGKCKNYSKAIGQTWNLSIIL